MNQSTGVHTQPDWFLYSGGDAPQGAARADSGITSAQAYIQTDALLPGTYRLFLKTLGYNNPGAAVLEVTAWTDSTTNTVIADDRDANRYWTDLGIFSVAEPSTRIHFSFRKTNGAAVAPTLFLGAYLTQNLTAYVNSTDVVANYVLDPTEDTSPPVAGNLLSNSSFEASNSGGWGVEAKERYFSWDNTWETNQAYHGTSCLRLPADSGGSARLHSKIIRVRGQKRHTFSVYVRASAATPNCKIGWASTLTPPAGFPAAPGASSTFTATTNWTRYSVSGIMYDYPFSEFNVFIESPSVSTLYIDAAQLQEGPSATPYAPEYPIELGFRLEQPGHIVFEGEQTPLVLRAFNNGAPLTATTTIEFFSPAGNRVRTDTLTLALSAGATVATNISLTSLPLGTLRAVAHFTGNNVPPGEEEFVFTRIRPPLSVAPHERILGTHHSARSFSLDIDARAGIGWLRWLSPGAYWRWATYGEPTPDNFIFYDRELDQITGHQPDISFIANMGEVVPVWAQRTYFTLSNVAGAFQPGEMVTQTPSGASGIVTVVLNATHITGHALQLSNVLGGFTAGQAIVGSLSGATAVQSSAKSSVTPDLDRWQHFVSTMVSHYANRGFWWECFNEPNQKAGSVSAPATFPEFPSRSPAFYAEFLTRFVAAAKQADPGCHLLGFGGAYDVTWMTNCWNYLSDYTRTNLDAVTVHYYGENAGLAPATMESWRSVAPTTPVWNDESGVWDFSNLFGPNGSWAFEGLPLQSYRTVERSIGSMATRPELLGKSLYQTLGAGMQRFFNYDSRADLSPRYQASLTTTLDQEGSYKMKGAVISTAASFLDGGGGLGALSLPPGSSTEGYLYTNRLGEALAVLWTTDRSTRRFAFSDPAWRTFDMVGNPLSTNSPFLEIGRQPTLLLSPTLSAGALRSAIASSTAVLVEDTTPPTVQIYQGPRGRIYSSLNHSLLFRWAAWDNKTLPDIAFPDSASYRYRLRNVDPTWSDWSGIAYAEYPSLPAGTNVFEVQARDEAGNISEITGREIVVPPCSTPAVTLTVMASDTTKVYGDPLPEFQARFSGFIDGHTPASLLSGPVLTSDAVSSSPVGTYSITPGETVHPAYCMNYVSGTLDVTPAPLRIQADDQTAIYGDPLPAWTASYHGFVDNEDAQVLHGVLAATSPVSVGSPVGTYAITVSGQTADNYAIEYVPGTLMMAPRTLTVVAESASRPYGQANPVLTGTLTGIAAGDNISVNYATTADPSSPVGSYLITPVLVDPDNRLGNYNIVSIPGTMNVTPANLTVSATDLWKTYGSANPDLTATVIGIHNGDPITAYGTSVVTSSSPAGVYSISPAVLDPEGRISNYSVQWVHGSFTVSKAPLSVAAVNQSRSYGLPNPEPEIAYAGFVNGDSEASLSGSPRVATTATPDSPAGIYPLVPEVGTLESPNYVFVFIEGNLTVTRSVLVVAADPKTRTYGASNPELSVTYSGFVNGEDASALTGTVELSTAADVYSPVGSHPILVGPGTLTSENYSFVFTDGWMTVTPAALTVRAESKIRTYGESNPELTVAYEGFVNNETPGVLGGAPELTTAADAGSAAGEYPIRMNAGTLTSSNYAFEWVDGTLTVSRAIITVSANPMMRIYGEPNPQFSVTYSGFVNSDDPSVLQGAASTTTTAVPTSQVGNYPITPGPGTLSAANYHFTFVDGLLTVNKALLTATADSFSRTYGSANPALTVTYSGFANGESAAVLSGAPVITTTAVAKSPVGAYPINLGSGTLSAVNYSILPVNGTLTVTTAVLTVRADPKTRVYGAANPTLTVTYTGFMNSDSSRVLSGSPTIVTTATAGSPVGGYPITPGAGTLGAANYSFDFVSGTLTVTKALLTVRADGKTRVYGAGNPALTATMTGFVNGDGAASLSGTPLLATTAGVGSPVGNYPITSGLGSLVAANYSFSFVNGTLSVTRAPLTVRADNKSRLVGTANPPLTASYTGFVNGETSSVLSGNPNLSTTAKTQSPTGTYPITVSQGSLGSANYSFTWVDGILTITSRLASSSLRQGGDLELIPASLLVTRQGVTIQWQGQEGDVFRVQYALSLADSEWMDLPSIIAREESRFWALDPLPGSPRFYRVVRTNPEPSPSRAR